MKLKVLLIGANGQLGSDLIKFLKNEHLIPLTHRDIEITNYKNVRSIINKYKPQVVINTAAYHKVDECEKNPLKAFKVNALGTRNVALVCKEVNSVLVFISTDYIFDGKKGKPYIETDPPNPLNVYGISKLSGELFVRSILEKYFIIRTSGLFGLSGSREKGGNFIETMLKLAMGKKEIKVVDDQIVSPTYTFDLAQKIYQLIKIGKFGIYHITNKGECSWYELAKKVFELMNIKVKLQNISTEKFGATAKRPKYSVLRNFKLEKLGIDDLRTWDKAVESYLKIKRRVK